MASISFRAVTKRYGDVIAVRNLDLEIRDKEFVVLLGPSGCGKTTTLRCVAGLEHPTGGEISIGGHVVSSPSRGILVPPRLRDLGMVFQSYAVWPHMTVRQNVIYPLKHRKMSRAEAGKAADDAARYRQDDHDDRQAEQQSPEIAERHEHVLDDMEKRGTGQRTGDGLDAAG